MRLDTRLQSCCHSHSVGRAPKPWVDPRRLEEVNRETGRGPQEEVPFLSPRVLLQELLILGAFVLKPDLYLWGEKGEQRRSGGVTKGDGSSKRESLILGEEQMGTLAPGLQSP